MLGIVVVVVSYTTSSILYGSLITFWDIIRKNTCDSRAPLGLLRPRGGSTPAPHSSPLRATPKERTLMTTSASGGRREALPRTDRSLPGMAENRKRMEIPALYLGTNACCAAVHPCTTQEQTLHQRMCCCMIRTAVHISCCVRTRRARGVERRGEANTAIPAPLWRGSAYLCYFFVFVFFVRDVPSPISGIVELTSC